MRKQRGINMLDKIKPWTIALFTLMLVDSIATTYIGAESNGMILWVMDKLGLTLKGAMIIRVFYYIPFIMLLNQYAYKFVKMTFIAYVSVYFVMGGIQLI